MSGLRIKVQGLGLHTFSQDLMSAGHRWSRGAISELKIIKQEKANTIKRINSLKVVEQVSMKVLGL